MHMVYGSMHSQVIPRRTVSRVRTRNLLLGAPISAVVCLDMISNSITPVRYVGMQLLGNKESGVGVRYFQ
jgi:hypothetical protein